MNPHSTSTYKLNSAAKGALLQWWHALASPQAGGSARADRATLARANDLTAVACTPAYQRLYRQMVAAQGGQRWPAWQEERIAAVAALLAHVVGNTEHNLPQAMSQRPESADRNAVSELRFSRLLNTPDIDALFTGLRRCLPLIKHQVNVASLVDDVFEWGDGVKKRWAYAYVWPEKAKA